MGGNKGVVRSGMITPTVCDRRVRRLRATGLGWYPSNSAASRTRWAVSSFTSSRVSGLRAREAVAGCTPARAATSRSVTACSVTGTPSAMRQQTTTVGRRARLDLRTFPAGPLSTPLPGSTAAAVRGRPGASEVRGAVLVRGAEHDRGPGGDVGRGLDLRQQVRQRGRRGDPELEYGVFIPGDAV